MADPASLDIDELIVAHMEGELTGADTGVLREALRADAAVRRRFVLTMLQTAALRDAHLASPKLALASPEPVAANLNANVSAAQVRRPRSRYGAAAIAAALLLTAAAFTIVAIALNHQPSPIDPRQSPAVPIATLIDVSGGGTLLVDDDIADPGANYAAGTYSIDSGSAEFLLASRVTVDL